MHISILGRVIEHVPATVLAVLKRQAGRLGLCDPWAQMCLPSLIQSLPPPTGTQGLSWTGGAPRRTGEGCSLCPALLALPHSSPCLSLASSLGPAP